MSVLKIKNPDGTWEQIRTIKGEKGESGIPQQIDMIDNVAIIYPNKYYKWGEILTLNITLGTPVKDTINEYMFEFKSGEIPTTLTVPQEIKWIGNTTIEANKTYQISIVNGIGVIANA